MALTGGKLAELKDRVPPQFKPTDKNTPDLGGSFADQNRVHERARDLDQRLHNLSVGQLESDKPGTSVNGFLQTGIVASAKATATEQDEKKKKDEEKFRRYLDWLNRYIAGLDGKIAFWESEHNTWNKRIDALDAAIDGLKSGGQLDLNEDGYPKDEELRAAIEAYEKSKGIKVDPNNPDDLEDVRRFAQGRAQFAKKNADKFKKDRDQAEELRKELEENPDNQAVIGRIDQKLQSESGLTEVSLVGAVSENTELKDKITLRSAGTKEAQLAAQEVISNGSLLDSGTSKLFGDAFSSETAANSLSFARSQDEGAVIEKTLGKEFNPAAKSDFADKEQSAEPAQSAGPPTSPTQNL